MSNLLTGGGDHHKKANCKEELQMLTDNRIYHRSSGKEFKRLRLQELQNDGNQD